MAIAVVTLCILLMIPQLHAEAEPGSAEIHRNKAGLYLRLPEAQREQRLGYYLNHPLVDAAIVSFGWSKIEPEPGRYVFTEIDKIFTSARKYHKGVVLVFAPYGQDPNTPPTPNWLYDRGVKRITFPGGGVSKGALISVPKVWDAAYLREYETFVQKIGERYGVEPALWYVMPGFGHLGNINPQPSKEGAPAFLREGWTQAIWKEFCLEVARLYQRAFPNIPLLVKAAPHLIRDKAQNNYLKEADEILVELARRGASVITFGLEPDRESLVRSNVLGRLARLSSYALSGAIRVGIGDDWPLWLPEERRKKQGFLSDRDEAGLARALQYAFGGIEGLPKSNISLIYVLHPEIEASHPDKGSEQNKEVYRLLAAARKRLKGEDPIAKLLNK